VKIWTPGDCQVGIENLNSTYAFDAVVDAAAGAASGSIYPTIGAALTAGGKSVLVRCGTYVENVNIGSANVRLIGERPPTSTASVRITGRLTVNGTTGVEVSNLLVAGGEGVQITGCADIWMHNVRSLMPTSGQCFVVTNVEGSTRIVLERCLAYGDGSTANGFLSSSPAAGLGSGPTSFVRCVAYNTGGSGFFIEGDDTGLYSGVRRYVLDGCAAYSCARVWGDGFAIGRRPYVAMSNCEGLYSGYGTALGSGLRVYVNDATNSRTVRVLGGRFQGNLGSGVILSAASSRVQLVGNHSHNNAVSLDWTNCGSCPGYAGNGLTAPGTNITG
jgi:hypothetical protein